jgi:hypothetical protein
MKMAVSSVTKPLKTKRRMPLGGLYGEALWTHFYSSQVRILSAFRGDADRINLRANWLKKVPVVSSSRRQTFFPTDNSLIYSIRGARTNFLWGLFMTLSSSRQYSVGR